MSPPSNSISPDVLNAMSLRMHDDLTRIDDGTARSSFGSAGKPGYPRITERFSFAKPLIAKVSGYALGGAFELVLPATLSSRPAMPNSGSPKPDWTLVAMCSSIGAVP